MSCHDPGHVLGRNLNESGTATARRYRPKSVVLLQVELDLAAGLVQDGEGARLAGAVCVVSRKLDGNAGGSQLVGGKKIRGCSWCEKAAPDDAKVIFAGLRVLQEEGSIANMVGENVAANALDPNGLLECPNVDEEVFVLECCLGAPAVHVDAMVKLVLGDAKSCHSVVEGATESVFSSSAGEHLQKHENKKCCGKKTTW